MDIGKLLTSLLLFSLIANMIISMRSIEVWIFYDRMLHEEEMWLWNHPHVLKRLPEDCRLRRLTSLPLPRFMVINFWESLSKLEKPVGEYYADEIFGAKKECQESQSTQVQPSSK
jgi:hypothetical protein